MAEQGFIKPYSGEEPYIFLSYSHKNTNAAIELVRRMMSDGYRVWYDEGIDPGTEWDENIAFHVKNCDYFIALMSAEYVESTNCRDEISFARDLNKPRLLIYLENVELPDGMHMRLNRLQAIHEYRYTDREAFYEKLYSTHGIGICLKMEQLQTQSDGLASLRKDASVYWEQGEYDKVLPLREQILNICRQKFGEEHPETLYAMSALADVYRKQKLDDEALILLERLMYLYILNICRTKFAKERPETLYVMDALTDFYRKRMWDDVALILPDKLRYLCRMMPDNSLREVLKIMNDLADTYRRVGRYDEALSLMEQVLEQRRAEFGMEDNDTLSTMNDLSVIYSCIDQQERALYLLNQVLSMRSNLLGTDHPDTLNTLYEMARTYQRDRDWKNALPLLQQALPLSQKIFGDNHAETFQIMKSLSSALENTGQYDEALPLMERILARTRRTLGAYHPETIRNMWYLYHDYHMLGMKQEEEKIRKLIEEAEQHQPA